jgi:hypothetical protein
MVNRNVDSGGPKQLRPSTSKEKIKVVNRFHIHHHHHFYKPPAASPPASPTAVAVSTIADAPLSPLPENVNPKKSHLKERVKKNRPFGKISSSVSPYAVSLISFKFSKQQRKCQCRVMNKPDRQKHQEKQYEQFEGNSQLVNEKEE